ncbi:DUF3347 domain-containing protein [Maribacter dokdonensis]|uniref:DUF3347 domain-containing protein n=1 Tax=Maribacter dokdonensis TaxID=320912 RepID=UPI0027360A8F|nr:DUF3347 domain-containing protein [Maribacter dokdonensis]MDP2524566.1 DUF3347 domain-containing protein [Maribacter dokdonensis]
MKTTKRNIGSMLFVTVLMLSVSCKETNKKSTPSAKEVVEKQEVLDETGTMGSEQNVSSESVLEDYFHLKNALVEDDNNTAKKLGGVLAASLGNLNKSSYTDSQQETLAAIAEDAQEYAVEISGSDLDSQREHFKNLSVIITDMIAITGSESTIYEQYCPMYDGGTAWLSKEKAVLNPYYGSSMLRCGTVQREVN